jgi:hypothetical protein
VAIAAVIEPINEDEVAALALLTPAYEDLPDEALFQSAFARLRPIVTPVAPRSVVEAADKEETAPKFEATTISVSAPVPAAKAEPIAEKALRVPVQNENELPWPTAERAVAPLVEEFPQNGAATLAPLRRSTESHRRQAALRRRRQATLARRRRTLLLAGIVGVVVLLALPLSSLGGRTVSGASTGSAVQGRTYVVQPGDTLFSIASSVAPKNQVRAMVRQLSRELGSNVVVPGERVTLP